MSGFDVSKDIIGAFNPEFGDMVMGKGVAGALIGLAAGGVYGWASGSGFWDAALSGALKFGLGGLAFGVDAGLSKAYGTMMKSSIGKSAVEQEFGQYVDLTPEELADKIVEQQFAQGGALSGMDEEMRTVFKEKALGDTDYLKAIEGIHKQIDLKELQKAAAHTSGIGTWFSALGGGVSDQQALAAKLARSTAQSTIRPGISRLTQIWDDLSE